MHGTIDSQFTVTTEDAFDETGANVILCKIADSMYEINVYLGSSDISKIIANGDVVGGCIAGRCANSNVHWHRDDLNALCLLIGHDQETWDLCLNLTPAQTLAVTEALRRCAAGDVDRIAK